MRLQLEEWKPPPKTKIQSWFAFWPVTIGLECRWLEMVTVERERWEWISDGTDTTYYWYRNVRFLDPEKEAA